MPLEFRGSLPPGRIITIGSAPDNDVVIDHPTVSRHHAIIDGRGILQRSKLRDLESTNGTIVKGRRIERPVVFRPDDNISIGAVKLRLNTDSFRAASHRAVLMLTLLCFFGLGFAATEYLLGQRLSPAHAPASSVSVKSQAVDAASKSSTAVAGPSEPRLPFPEP
ncbi:MAG: FHA domain-containing protein, partial [Deltaproteobacteria bacterium]|nr:FHA domain-containing protein [Deltaproteobacteria bacterium]